MKRKKILIGCTVTILALMGIYIFQINDAYHKLKVTYNGISEHTFHYDLNTDNVSCKYNPDYVISNGDIIKFQCQDRLTGLLTKEIPVNIEGLYDMQYTEKNINYLKSPFTENIEAVLVKETDEGLNFILVQDYVDDFNDQYMLSFYEHLAVKNNNFVQLDIQGNDIKEVPIKNLGNTIIPDEMDFNAYIKKQIRDGYTLDDYGENKKIREIVISLNNIIS